MIILPFKVIEKFKEAIEKGAKTEERFSACEVNIADDHSYYLVADHKNIAAFIVDGSMEENINSMDLFASAVINAIYAIEENKKGDSNVRD